MRLHHIITVVFLSLFSLTACDSDKDLTVVEIPVTPYEIDNLWMVGDATAAGWDIDNLVQMEKTDTNVFRYEGTLSEGEFKCPMKPGNWGGPFIMPSVNGVTISRDGAASDEISLMPDGNPDNKWVVTESGNYQIIIDGNKHKIHVICLN
ncbi:MAG: SusF/SusE family outer membrane protein [Muribaculaceae bacterium]|nr:SusF/SusE family outer membrane protein [Muribaculaceae bacterium]